MSSIQPGGNFMRRMPVGGTANLARCFHVDGMRLADGKLLTARCANLAANGTVHCLEHAEPRGAARPVLPSPYTTEAPPKPAPIVITPVTFLPPGGHIVTVGFHEPPQPCTLRRLLTRWFA